MKTNHQIRRDTKKALKGNWFIAIVATFIASAFGGLSFGSQTASVSVSLPPVDDFAGLTDPDTLEMILNMYSVILAVAGVMGMFVMLYNILYLVVGSAVSVGYSQFNIDVIDGKKPRLETLFESFRIWVPAVIARFLVGLYTTLWTLLFIIPGIIATYSYAMTPFVLAENPGMSASDAITESKTLMRGNKWKLFCLEFSFIGWYLLSMLTFGIALIWVVPYHQASYAAFYREICPKRIHEPIDSFEF
jgi:uncharacterized membrane protein